MELPNIKKASIGNLEVCLSDSIKYRWELLLDGRQWNTWHMLGNYEIRELQSSVDIAYGKVIATGLGFCLRESMLLANENVTEIVVLENNPNVIEYHKIHNPDIMSKITVIECDANTYTGSCDVLLLDHYEIFDIEAIRHFTMSLNLCTKNIEHNLVWWWALEELIPNFDSYVAHCKVFKLPELTEDAFKRIIQDYREKQYEHTNS